LVLSGINHFTVKRIKKLFEAEHRDLIEDLVSLPRNSAVRKINELVKRSRLVRTHAYIISYLREKMPLLIGKETVQTELIKNLGNIYREIERQKKVPIGDFPDITMMQNKLKHHDFTLFEKESDRLIRQIDNVLNEHLPNLMKVSQPQKSLETNPFLDPQWEVSAEVKANYDQLFNSLATFNGKVMGSTAREALLNTGIQVDYLRKIWELCDFEKDGTLDIDEFALALHLTEIVKTGKTIPDTLPMSLIPPTKRKYFNSK